MPPEGARFGDSPWCSRRWRRPFSRSRRCYSTSGGGLFLLLAPQTAQGGPDVEWFRPAEGRRRSEEHESKRPRRGVLDSAGAPRAESGSWPGRFVLGIGPQSAGRWSRQTAAPKRGGRRTRGVAHPVRAFTANLSGATCRGVQLNARWLVPTRIRCSNRSKSQLSDHRAGYKFGRSTSGWSEDALTSMRLGGPAWSGYTWSSHTISPSLHEERLP